MLDTFGLTDEGLTVPRTRDFLTVMLDSYATDTGITLDPQADIVLYDLFAIAAVGDDANAQILLAIYAAKSRGNASGNQLDDLGLLIDVPRKAATYSTVTVVCTGTMGTVIPSGRLVEGGGTDGTQRWATTSDITLGPGNTPVVAQAVDLGAIGADPGTITTIVTNVAGWATVTNIIAASPGRDMETDAEYRVRQQIEVSNTGGMSVIAIQAALLAIVGVEGAVVVDNKLDVPVVTGGVPLDPHSIAAILYPPTLTVDQTTAVATVLFDQAAEGITQMGTVTGTVIGDNGQTFTMTWAYATTVTATVAATVVLDDGYVLGDVSAACATAITDYIASLTVGQDVRLLQLYKAIGGVTGVVGVSALTINTFAVDLAIDLNQLAIAGVPVIT